MSKQATGNNGATTQPIPDKLYFRIGEVAKLCGVEAYVLRFWESEFPQLKPNKGGTGQRLYRKREVELALRIKTLLYSEGYTIAGARQIFAAEQREPRKKNQSELPLDRDGKAEKTDKTAGLDGRLKKLRSEMMELLGMLSVEPATRSRATKATPIRQSSRKNESGPGLFDGNN
ncbi:MerR family transcriptional regulator [Silvibacterium acidisoli]|uniref:MerR family transcriptional regulator n=1 Tax=Acidobacteriaceae bacterium ZG23-2 TaxID=2883246 RepID=UPI00406BFE30